MPQRSRSGSPVSDGRVFVFGSNLAGRHGAGAALHAKLHCGAIYGQGIGRQGMSYGIPTKGHRLEVLPLTEIAKYVADFLVYAGRNFEERFHVTAIGTGLAGYKQSEIAPMFVGAPENCDLPDGWRFR